MPPSLVAVLLLLSSAPADAAGRYALDLPAGPLLGCLEQVTAVTGVALVDRSGLVSSRLCEALHATLELEQVLDHLLGPAGLSWRRRADGAIEIVAPDELQLKLDALVIDSTPLPDTAPAAAANPPVTALAQQAMSLTRVDASRLHSAPLLSLTQLGRFAPNVYSSGAGLAIRGQERDMDYYSGLNLYYDGIELGSFLMDGDLVSVEGLDRVQIERGPRSFERGSAAAGGALELYTPAPADTPTSRLSLGLGNGGGRRIGASWSGPLGRTGDSGLRLGVERREVPNYVREQRATAANTDRRSIDNFSAKLAMQPERLPGLSFTLALLGVDGDDAPLAGSDIYRPQQLLHDYVSTAYDALRMHTRALGGAAQLQYVHEDWTWRAHWRHLLNRRDGIWYSADFPPSGSATDERRDGSGISLQRRFDDGELVVGGNTSLAQIDEADLLILDNASRRAEDVYRGLRTDSTSLWIWGERHWREQFHLGLGLRHIRETARANSLRSVCQASQDLPQPGDCSRNGVARSWPLRASATAAVPLMVARWTPSAAHELGLSYGSGTRSSAGFDTTTLDEMERDDTTQLTWDVHGLAQRLVSRLAVFHTRIRNRFNGNFAADGARGSVDGVEWELTAQLSTRWRIDAALGWMDAEYSHYTFEGAVNPTIAGAPARSFNLGWRYDSGAGAYASGNYYRTAAAESSPGTGAIFRRAGYQLIDLRLGYRRDDWDLSLIGTNIGDTHYFDRIDMRTFNLLNEGRFRLGEPRRIELRFQYDW